MSIYYKHKQKKRMCVCRKIYNTNIYNISKNTLNRQRASYADKIYLVQNVANKHA